MPKNAQALQQLPPSTQAALKQLGEDLARARLRRKESLRAWAKRMRVSVPTLVRLEAGEASVSLGVLATALWLIGREGSLASLAAPDSDEDAITREVRAAEELGRARARAARKIQSSSKKNNPEALDKK